MEHAHILGPHVIRAAQLVRQNAVAVGVAVTVAVSNFALRYAGASGRRLVAAALLTIGISLVRLAIMLLPRDAPTRVFISGALESVTVKGRHVARVRRAA